MTTDADRTGDAERLRHGVNRLARLMRHQDDGDLGATATAALATVRKRGPLTLGELASFEQVSPPTMTKVVEKLESRGFVTRRIDPDDRRVARVNVTAAGTRYLERTRARVRHDKCRRVAGGGCSGSGAECNPRQSFCRK